MHLNFCPFWQLGRDVEPDYRRWRGFTTVAGRESGLFDGEWVKGGFSPVKSGSATGQEKCSGIFFENNFSSGF
jgi:hypothetical protein